VLIPVDIASLFEMLCDVVETLCASIVSDIAIFVLKRDVKLQLTNLCAS